METPEQLYARARGRLRVPPVHEWPEWPFEGVPAVKELLPPLSEEPPRHGEGGEGCRLCSRPDEEAVWADDRWRLFAMPEPSGLPVVVFLAPREHCDLGTLPDGLASGLGTAIARVERAIQAAGEVGRVHVCRYGDGSEHLHLWFFARPARLPQVRTMLTALWDDVLPPVPRGEWHATLAAVASALAADGGTAHVT